MNKISNHVSYIFGNKQQIRELEKIGNTEELGSKRGQIEGPKNTREAKLTHGN